MAKMKWDLNGRGVAPKQPGEGNNYNGPDLPKGSWPAKIKRMTVHEIQSKANLGKPRISVLLEVQSNLLEGKEAYHGAPVWDNLNIIDSAIPFVNGFLHSLSNGTEAGKRAIESAFWDEDKGPDFRKVKVEKGNRAGEVDTHIVKIGKVQINSPKGEVMVQITTRPDKDPNTGKSRPVVTGYLPFQGEQAAADDEDDIEDDIDEDEDDMLESDDEDDEDDEDEDEDEDDEDEDADDDGEEEDSDKPAVSGRRKAHF